MPLTTLEFLNSCRFESCLQFGQRWSAVGVKIFFDHYYRWHAVASWTWDAQDETCGICRMAFDGCCPDCKLPGDDCPLSKSRTSPSDDDWEFISSSAILPVLLLAVVWFEGQIVWGACNHSFHLHCILKWVNSQTPQAHCPMCRREWQFKA
ncbi:Anaphase-promoting complex subunit 11, RING-H2 finger [Dillenia turbinata]|uniref:Anaphase-promoting complex subunit 11 n=1 Tax=Dillenia turbinata TaxID=194707 RepID=A0AAN8ZFT7_9MAGN